MPTYSINVDFAYLYKRYVFNTSNPSVNASALWFGSSATYGSAFGSVLNPAGQSYIGVNISDAYGGKGGQQFYGETVNFGQLWFNINNAVNKVSGSESLRSASLNLQVYTNGNTDSTALLYENSSSLVFLGAPSVTYWPYAGNIITASPNASQAIYASAVLGANGTFAILDFTNSIKNQKYSFTVSDNSIKNFNGQAGNAGLNRVSVTIVTDRVKHGTGIVSAATNTPNVISACAVQGESEGTSGTKYFYYTNGSHPLVTYGGSVSATTGSTTASSLTVSASSWSASPQYDGTFGNYLAMIVSTLSASGTASAGVLTPSGWSSLYNNITLMNNSTNLVYGYQIFGKPSSGNNSDNVTFIQSSSVNSLITAQGVYFINAAGIGVNGSNPFPNSTTLTYPQVNFHGFSLSKEISSFPTIVGVWSNNTLQKITASVGGFAGLLSSLEVNGYPQTYNTGFNLSAFSGFNGKIMSSVNTGFFRPYALNNSNKANYAIFTINNGLVGSYSNYGTGTAMTSSSATFLPYNLDKDSSSVGYLGNSTSSTSIVGASSVFNMYTPLVHTASLAGVQAYISQNTYFYQTDSTFNFSLGTNGNGFMDSSRIYSGSIIQSNNSQLISSIIGSFNLSRQSVFNLNPDTEYDINISASTGNPTGVLPTPVPMSGPFKYVTPSSSPVGFGNCYFFLQSADYGKGGIGFAFPSALVSNNSNYTSASVYSSSIGYQLFRSPNIGSNIILAPRPFSDKKGKFFSVHADDTNSFYSNGSVFITLYRYEFINNYFISSPLWNNGTGVLNSSKQILTVETAQAGYTNKGMGWVFSNSNNNNILVGGGKTRMLSKNGGGTWSASTFSVGNYSTGNLISSSVVLTGFKNNSNLVGLAPYNLMSASAIAIAVTGDFGDTWTEYSFTASANSVNQLMVQTVSPVIMLNNKYFVYYFAYMSSNVTQGSLYAASANSLSGPWTTKTAFGSSSYWGRSDGTMQYYVALEKSLSFNASAVCFAKPYASEAMDTGSIKTDTFNGNTLWSSTDGWNFASASFPVTNSRLSDGPRWSPSSSTWFFVDVSAYGSGASVYYNSDVTGPLSAWSKGAYIPEGTVLGGWSRMFIA